MRVKTVINDMEKRLVRVGITQGDINGISYELILKAFLEEQLLELCTPVIYGSLKVAQYYQKLLALEPIHFNVIKDGSLAVDGKVNIVNCVGSDLPINVGESTAEAGLASYKSLEFAVSDMKKGYFDTLVTCPINKHNIQNESFHFPGHTEYLEEQFGENKYKSLMILMTERLKVALVTGHIALNEVGSQITQDAVVNKLKLFNTSLLQDFNIVKPRLAVLSLNPHGGDDGLIGSEENTIIIPAIKEAEQSDVMSFGPYAADGFFGAGSYVKFDGILAMYHDQGLAPFKALAMDEGVNFTAGLPIVRTSPAHGTAYDIAGKNIASPESFRQAIYTSIDIFRNRIFFKEATANPLRKQYVDRGGYDNVKLDLTKDE